MTPIDRQLLIAASPAPAIDPELLGEADILAKFGFKPRALAVALQIARFRGTTMAEELIRLHYLRPDDWWEAVARDLGLRHFRSLFLAEKPIDTPLPDARHFRSVRQVWHQPSDRSLLIVAPRGLEFGRLKRRLAEDPDLRQRLAIASPPTIRRAVRKSYEAAMTHQAITRLRRDRPAMSAASGSALARRMMTAVLAALGLVVFAPLLMLSAIEGLFLVGGGLRLAAALQLREPERPAALADHDLPTYAVMVPLYREAHVVADLIRALDRLDYPRNRLVIHLIVEADDSETLAAAYRVAGGYATRVIAVPPSRPRTKPKALVWALPFIAADLLTVYDAEDRPAPDQLRLAAAAFAVALPDVVCLQARLDIDHAASSNNWLARQFALEYRVLFGAVLPWLARQRLFLPIGGTSNHFRTQALLDVGAWDPYNVTEDADLSVRIFRAGGRIEVLNSVTTEEAPVTWRAWHLQRTRWIKGWLQTSLVHMRDPRQLLRDLGPLQFAIFQIMIPGQIISALAYPVGVLLVAFDALGLVPLFADRSFTGDLVLAFQVLALACGWLGALAAILATARADDRSVRGGDLATVPLYWFLLFAAAIHAAIELVIDPHRWNKTKHGIAARSDERGEPRFPARPSDGSV